MPVSGGKLGMFRKVRTYLPEAATSDRHFRSPLGDLTVTSQTPTKAGSSLSLAAAGRVAGGCPAARPPSQTTAMRTEAVRIAPHWKQTPPPGRRTAHIVGS